MLLEIYYFNMRVMKDARAKRQAIMMVELKSTFSNPLFVCWVELKLSPPKAAPKPASDLCNKTATIKSMDSTICM